MFLRIGNIDVDATATVSCNGCNKAETTTIDGALDFAREHHDIFDHEPHKLSDKPDIHNSFSLATGPHILTIETSSMNARLMNGNETLFTKHYAPSHLERIF